jgi:hypothetical protein
LYQSTTVSPWGTTSTFRTPAVRARISSDLILCNLRILHDGCTFNIGSCQLQRFPLGLGHGGDPGVIGRLAFAEGLLDGVGDDLDFREGVVGIKQDGTVTATQKVSAFTVLIANCLG